MANTNLAYPDDRKTQLGQRNRIPSAPLVRWRRSRIPISLEPYAAQWTLSRLFARDVYAVDRAVVVVATRRQRITSRS